MKLFEYEAKSLAQNLGINIPKGAVATTPDEARDIHKRIGGEVVVKAQVLVAGRGKAGGIKFSTKPDDTRDRATEILNMTIKGEKVKKVLIEQKLSSKKELYASIVLDRTNKCQTVLASDQGGIDIEEVAKTTPEKVVRHRLDPVFGMRSYDARDTALKVGYKGNQLNTLADLLSNLYRLSVIYDAELVESNPIVETQEGRFVAADLRVIMDDNSLFRHPEFQERSKEVGAELTPLEAKARENGLSFVELDGDIGIIGNGAGLVMATLDIVKYYGGKPANFCDVGGGADAEHVATALQIIQGDPKVSRVFVNILAGITRCDEVAKGIVDVKKIVGLRKPLVIRMQGTNYEEGKRILDSEGITALGNMDEAARLVTSGNGGF
ncbi:MAG TPA: ADP-forming succinate--CoA ligase subunit beta [Candidatus Bathyarchaeia archaeon]|nr:ADP-forming succinate--CoA ligase subunit beta [Candidatus Bathyarchaeia archaeon]